MGGEQVSRDSPCLCVLARANESLMKSSKIWEGDFIIGNLLLILFAFYLSITTIILMLQSKITAILQIYLYDVKGGEKVINLEIMSSEAEEE